MPPYLTTKLPPLVIECAADVHILLFLTAPWLMTRSEVDESDLIRRRQFAIFPLRIPSIAAAYSTAVVYDVPL